MEINGRVVFHEYSSERSTGSPSVRECSPKGRAEERHAVIARERGSVPLTEPRLVAYVAVITYIVAWRRVGGDWARKRRKASSHWTGAGSFGGNGLVSITEPPHSLGVRFSQYLRYGVFLKVRNAKRDGLFDAVG